MGSAASRELAVLAAAGSSRRMGGSKKEYASLGSESVLSASLRSLLDAGITLVAVTIPQGGEDAARASIDPPLLKRPGTRVLFVTGGASRRASVLSGLLGLEPLAGPGAIVLIHDAARPWAGVGLMEKVMDAARREGAAIPLVPTVDTLKEIDTAGFVRAHIDRSRVMAVQTPQGFNFHRVLAAHRSVAALIAEQKAADDFTDDAQIWEAAGMGKIAWVEGHPGNKKITYPEDVR